ncbi:MAG: hypothetical protein R2713_10495 [Ilumatobacteraceae bacterium]
MSLTERRATALGDRMVLAEADGSERWIDAEHCGVLRRRRNRTLLGRHLVRRRFTHTESAAPRAAIGASGKRVVMEATSRRAARVKAVERTSALGRPNSVSLPST